MTAQLLLVLVVQTMLGSVPVTVLVPMKNMAYCAEWKADPAPIIPAGGTIVQVSCVDLGEKKPAANERPA